MLIKVKSTYFFGIEAFAVDVEVNILDRSMPGFDIVGLAGREVEESRERVKAAISNTFKEFPYHKKIMVNLAPADVPKEGSYYDLPIAAALISSMRDVQFPADSAFFGELSLDGSTRKIKGAYLFASFAKEHCLNNIFIPADCYEEVKNIKGINLYPIKTLKDLLDYETAQKVFFAGSAAASRKEADGKAEKCLVESIDFSDVVGQDSAKRALEISACGGHNLLMMGSPGSGKTMLAKALCAILPKLSPEETSEVAKVYSACGLFEGQIFTDQFRPFRHPHHTVSYSGMVGGGSIPRPGEISLAHKGVLFLDELSEFQSPIIECLRQPMEDGHITIVRSRGSVKLPCDFTLVACTNPCPCGFFGDKKGGCVCKPWQVERYQKKLSGPILDRVDLLTYVWSPSRDGGATAGDFLKSQKRASPIIKERVEEVRAIQRKRFAGLPIELNSRMTNSQVKQFCALSSEGQDLLGSAIEQFRLSPRSVYKVLKVARTIADMEASEHLAPIFLAEAVQYKVMT
ncbi:YifB family Mg chelatase-like AAA ATPase [Patescibacteria group bacterium]|nr:YifB family Mg chelatase-like AAA ATPase [Patescibacteria group bacterium]